MYCSGQNKMILCWEFLEVSILTFESIFVKQFWWFLMIQLLSRHVSFDGEKHAICVLWIKGVSESDAGLVLISYCHSIFHQTSIHLGVVYGVILNLTTEVTCISVFPGCWKNFPMILLQELPMTLTVAYIDSPSM